MRSIVVALTFVLVGLISGTSAVGRTTPPSGKLPILYINTVDRRPVDQKEFYIEATAWLDASMTKEFESLGSPDEPVSLGIRGRGNATWFNSEKKPYKLRFDEKQTLMGNEKNRHFALLHLQGSTTSFFHEPLAFRAAELLGDEWVPTCKPCEVVLNDEYLGLYFLTETVRVDKKRVNITEQQDLETDPEKVDSGWLVEIDNNPDDNQIQLTEPNGRPLLLTFHSPEILSVAQMEFIESEFREICNRVHGAGGSSDDWMELVDAKSMARHYILNEIMQNYDGFCGSFYWHKDKGTKWIIGPAWDYGYSLMESGIGSYLTQYEAGGRPNLVREMLNSAEFREIVRVTWEEFYDYGTDWVDEVVDDWVARTAAAGEQNFLIWGVGEAMGWRGTVAAQILKDNMEWFHEFVYSELFTDWEFTDIPSVQSSPSEPGEWFDLLGRRMRREASQSCGVYIKNGRKYVVR